MVIISGDDGSSFDNFNKFIENNLNYIYLIKLIYDRINIEML